MCIGSDDVWTADGLSSLLCSCTLYSCVFFFFSSRRRHTRCSRDWSSDVCSSDLRKVRFVYERVKNGQRCRCLGLVQERRRKEDVNLWALRLAVVATECLEQSLRLVWCSYSEGLFGSFQAVHRRSGDIATSQQVPWYLEEDRASFRIRACSQHLAHVSMQVLSHWPRHPVIRLRPDQLVAELETAMHLPQDTFLLQPGERFPRPGGSQVHDLVQRQVRKAAAEHRGEIQRRAGPPVEPSNLALEHGGHRAGGADVRDRVRVQSLEVGAQRARPVGGPPLRQKLR